MSRMPVKWTQNNKVRGKCDYCNKKRLVNRKTKFCDECYYEWNLGVDKYMDGNPFTVFEAAGNLMAIGVKKRG